MAVSWVQQRPSIREAPRELLKLTKVGPTPEVPTQRAWGESPAPLSFGIPRVPPTDDQNFNHWYRVLSFMEKGGKTMTIHSYLLAFSERNSKRIRTKKNISDYWVGRNGRIKNERYGGIFALYL